MEDKLKNVFGNMLVYKSPSNAKIFSVRNLPSFMRDWLVIRFADSEGKIDTTEVSDYIDKTITKTEQWDSYMIDLLSHNKPARFFAKVKIDFDTSKRRPLFSLPDFKFPKRKDDAVADWDVVEKHKKYLLSPTEAWGIVEITCRDDDKGKNIFLLIDFVPFCSYTIDLEYYVNARENFSVDEWANIILGAVDYNSDGYKTQLQKFSMLKRLLPFVEKRLNLIELAPKETGKSYIFSQISKYGWLISGGSITRAKMFY